MDDDEFFIEEGSDDEKMPFDEFDDHLFADENVEPDNPQEMSEDQPPTEREPTQQGSGPSATNAEPPPMEESKTVSTSDVENNPNQAGPLGLKESYPSNNDSTELNTDGLDPVLSVETSLRKEEPTDVAVKTLNQAESVALSEMEAASPDSDKIEAKNLESSTPRQNEEGEEPKKLRRFGSTNMATVRLHAYVDPDFKKSNDLKFGVFNALDKKIMDSSCEVTYFQDLGVLRATLYIDRNFSRLEYQYVIYSNSKIEYVLEKKTIPRVLVYDFYSISNHTIDNYDGLVDFSDNQGASEDLKKAADRSMFYQLEYQDIINDTNFKDLLDNYIMACDYLKTIFKYFKIVHQQSARQEFLNALLSVMSNKGIKSVCFTLALLKTAYEEADRKSKAQNVDHSQLFIILGQSNLDGEMKKLDIYFQSDDRYKKDLIISLEKVFHITSSLKNSVYLIEYILALEFNNRTFDAIIKNDKDRIRLERYLDSFSSDSGHLKGYLDTLSINYNPSSLLVMLLMPAILSSESEHDQNIKKYLTLPFLLFSLKKRIIQAIQLKTDLARIYAIPSEKIQTSTRVVSLVETALESTFQSSNSFLAIQTSEDYVLFSYLLETIEIILMKDANLKILVDSNHVMYICLILVKVQFLIMTCQVKYNRDWFGIRANQDYLTRSVNTLDHYFGKYGDTISFQIEGNDELVLRTIWHTMFEMTSMFNPEFNALLSDSAKRHLSIELRKLEPRRLVWITRLCLEQGQTSLAYQKIQEHLINCLIVQLEPTMDHLKELPVLAEFNVKAINQLALTLIHAVWPRESEAEKSWYEFFYDHFQFLEAFILRDMNMDANFQIGKNNKLKSIIDLLNLTINSLEDGSIKKDTLDFLDQSLDSFLELIKTIDSMKESPEVSHKLSFGWVSNRDLRDGAKVNTVKTLIQLRVKEVENFIQQLYFVTDAHEYFRKIKHVDLDNFEETFEKYKEIVKVELSEIIDPIRWEEDLSEKDHQELMTKRIKVFQEVLQEKDFLCGFFRLVQGNDILLRQIKQRVREIQNPLSINVYVKNILKASVTSYANFGLSVADGTYKLDEFSDLIKELKEQRKMENIEIVWKRELTRVLEYVKSEKMNYRLQQLEIFLKLNTIKDITNLLVKLVDLEFEGARGQAGFQDLNEIDDLLRNQDFTNKTVDDIDEIMMRLIQRLIDLSREDFSICLEKFVKHHAFIVRLRETAKTPNDLAVITEFASEVESEAIFDVNLYQKLAAVGNTYGPLIYELNGVKSFTKLLEKLIRVKDNLENNPLMAKRLEEIAPYTGWLEDVKTYKKSSYESAVKQASIINSHGYYEINQIEKTQKDFTGPSFEKLIQLKLGPAANSKKKTYNYYQLIDLNDRLTLVADNSEHHQLIIQTFTDVFDQVLKIVNELLKLMKTGHLLFFEWKATIYCAPDSPNVIEVYFFSPGSDSFEIIEERRREKTKTHEHAENAYSFLRDCNQLWEMHVKTKRDTFHELNYFTYSQIRTLRAELVKLNPEYVFQNDNERDTYVNRLASLLYNLQNDINIDKLKRAFQESLKQMKSYELDEEKKDLAKKLKELKFTNEEIEYLFSIKEFKHVKDAKKCLKSKPKGKQTELKPERVPKIDTRTTVSRKERLSLAQKYEQIKSEELENNIGIDCNRYVSVDRLGRFLKKIQLKSDKGIKRNCIFLKPNVPNLFLCSQSQVISTVLSIYDESKDQPLPTNDEVLFCTSTTTAEDLMLFWKRVFQKAATHANEQKIYCLVNAQDVLFDHASKAQEVFDSLFADYNQDRQKNKLLFCIVCSSESEAKSVIVTSFNRYKQTTPTRPNPNYHAESLRRYLFSHLKYKGTASKSVAHVEKDQLNVRVIRSNRAGCGKSLYVTRVREQAQAKIKDLEYVCIPIKSQTLQFEDVFKQLEQASKSLKPKIFHFDIAYEVWYGVDAFLFNLLCLNYLCNSDGSVWRRSAEDLYLIEIMPPLFEENEEKTTGQSVNKAQPPKDSSEDIVAILTKEMNGSQSLHSVLDFLPTLHCLTPKVIQKLLKAATLISVKIDHELTDKICPMMFDQERLCSENIQRPCQYLQKIQVDNSKANLETFIFNKAKILDPSECLGILLGHVNAKLGLADPSWAILTNLANFLNKMLEDVDGSAFCNPELSNQIKINGFRTFAIQFIIRMSDDFALPSLKISDESALKISKNKQVTFEIKNLNMRQKWENNPHPYLFINADGFSFTFFGFNLERESGKLKDPNTKEVIWPDVTMTRELTNGIGRQQPGVLREDVNNLSKERKILKLLNVIKVDWNPNDFSSKVLDPDPSYELTMDNMLKMLAIYMRFRADIPVIIMGETGCGKTSLIEYMCKLQRNPRERHRPMKILHLMRVHGGTTSRDIEAHVREAERMALQNRRQSNQKNMYTVLFFDEANTTEAIGTIKEIMCDNRCNGRPINKDCGLKIIAACNPYKKHSDEAIASFEKSGLGFYVNMNETQEKLGDIPMRHLVYRVQPLPTSMLPMIWDFGTLTNEIEKYYVAQIIKRKYGDSSKSAIKFEERKRALMIELLTKSQEFTRNSKEECNSVSLRNVQRALDVFEWFMKKGSVIFAKSSTNQPPATPTTPTSESEEAQPVPNFNSSVILALNASYSVGLQSPNTRENYFQLVAKIFNDFNEDQVDKGFIESRINESYDALLDEIALEPSIAPNQALKENFFMMLLCIELKIPLFIIGKPGSSKSLAKKLVSQMMNDQRSHSPILKQFKKADIITFQCSLLSTSEMIIKAFRACAGFQEERKQDLGRYASVVVLDEIGLAEAASTMPLKTLHPLLEQGAYFEEKEESQEWQKIGFIGISNWVLDPAKMNRGIFVNRVSPGTKELVKTAESICNRDVKVLEILKKNNFIVNICRAYETFCSQARTVRREFFGLRDFYCLMKMIYYDLKAQGDNKIDWSRIARFIKHNFGGLAELDPVESFSKTIPMIKLNSSRENVLDLINESLNNKMSYDDNRYLLLIAQNERAIDILKGHTFRDQENIRKIFGSSFPDDRYDYSQICQLLHQIKLNMEKGSTIILLNLENLYESLYDAFNQSYLVLDEDRYIDIGLGTQRVKCFVHQECRLVIVGDQKSVYETKKYPIPLLNRLEKHILSIDELLTDEMNTMVSAVNGWCQEICSCFKKEDENKDKVTPRDVFVGLTDDTINALVFTIFKKFEDKELYNSPNKTERMTELVKSCLLQCATTEYIIYLKNDINARLEKYKERYFVEQHHSSFQDFLQFHGLREDGQKPSQVGDFFSERQNRFIQITTFARLLTNEDTASIRAEGFQLVAPISLLSINRKKQFCKLLNDFYGLQNDTTQTRVLIIQCENGKLYTDLIRCARYTIIETFDEFMQESHRKNIKVDLNFQVILIIKLPKILGGCIDGFQTTDWLCYNIDDLIDDVNLGNIIDYFDMTVLGLLKDESRRHLIRSLLNSGLHGACALIKDVNLHKNTLKSQQKQHIETQTEHTKQRNVTRIDVLKNLISQEPSSIPENIKTKFYKVLLDRIVEIQENRDRSSQKPNKIIRAGTRHIGVANYGSLKNSCIKFIESELSYLLGGVIAKLDQNDNLELLSDKQAAELWLQMFDKSFVKVNYQSCFLLADNRTPKTDFECFKDVILVRKESELIEYKMKTPFSWKIKRDLDELAKLNLGQTDDQTSQLSNKLFTLRDMIDASNVDAKKLIEDYMNDFLLMSISGSSLCDKHLSLALGRFKRMISKQESTDITVILSFHMTYERLKNEFRIFGKLVGLNPDLLNEAYDFENNLALQCAGFAYQSMYESSLVANKNEWLRWFEKLQDYGEIFTELVRAASKEEVDTIPLKELKIWSHNVTAVKYVMHHFKDLQDEILVKLESAWKKFLRPPANGSELELEEVYRRFIAIMHEIDDALRGMDIVQQLKCQDCGAYNNRVLFEMKGCGKCRVCAKCKDIYIANKKCKPCEIPMPERQPFYQELTTKALYHIFQKRFNVLYMDIVQYLCYNDRQVFPESIFRRVLDHTIESKITNDSAIFELNSQVRMNVISLLLQFNSREVDQHLEYVLSDLNRDRDLENDVELNKLCIQAMETNLSTKSVTRSDPDNAASDLRKAREELDHLNELMDRGEPSVPHTPSHVEKLKQIAGIRFVLSTFAEIVATYKSRLEKNSTGMRKEHQDFATVLQKFMSKQGSKRLNYFLAGELRLRLQDSELLRNILMPPSRFSWIKVENEILTEFLKKLDCELKGQLELTTRFEKTLEVFIRNSRYWWHNAQTIAEQIRTFSNEIKSPDFNVLKQFLRSELQMLKYVPSICQMLGVLEAFLQDGVERQYAESMTVEKLIESVPSEKSIIEEGLDHFFKAFRSMPGEINVESIMLDDWPNLRVSFLLPSTSGDGAYIYKIFKRAVELHNSMLNAFARDKYASLEKQEFRTAFAGDAVAFLHEKDLLRLILLYSSYDEARKRHEYYFDRMQDDIEQNVLNKCYLIDEKTIPIFNFTQQPNENDKLVALNESVPQYELSEGFKETLLTCYTEPMQLSDIIELLRVVIINLGINGCDPETTIMKYAIESLKMKKALELSNQHLEVLEVCHLNSVYNLLTLYRAIMLTGNNLDPLFALDSHFKADMESQDLAIFSPDTSADDNLRLTIHITKRVQLFNQRHLLVLLDIIYQYSLQLSDQTPTSNKTNHGPETDLQDAINSFVKEREDEAQTYAQDEDSRFYAERTRMYKNTLVLFNLSGIKLKHLFFLWKFLVEKYRPSKNGKTN